MNDTNSQLARIASVDADRGSAKTTFIIEGIVVAWFIVWTLILLGPVTTHFSQIVYGEKGDNTAEVRSLWRRRQPYIRDIVRSDTNLLFYPLGSSHAVTERPGVNLTLGDFVNPTNLLRELTLPWLNEVAVFNLQAAMYLLLTGLSMYWLIRYLSKNRMAGVVVSSLYMWAPGQLREMWEHVHFGGMQWLILFFLALLWYLENFSLVRIIVAGMMLGMTAAANPYYGWFAVESVILFGLVFAAYQVIHKDWRGLARTAAQSLVLGLLLLAAVRLAFPTYLETLLDREAVREQIEHAIEIQYTNESNYYPIRPPIHMYMYSAFPWEFVIPADTHPLVGHWRKDVNNYLDERDINFETWMHFPNIDKDWPSWALELNGSSQHYLGIVNVVLAIIGVTTWRKDKRVERSKDIGMLFLVALAIAVPWLALPPQFPLGRYAAAVLGRNLPLVDHLVVVQPSYWLYYLAPQFRVYARMGVVAQLCVSALAGVGLAALWKRFEYNWQQVGLALVVLAVGLFEFWREPFAPTSNISTLLPEYEFISQQSGSFAIVDRRKPEQEQRYHGQPYLDYDWWKLLAESSFDPVPILSGLDVRYVVLPNDKPVPENFGAEGVERVFEADEVDVYEIEAEPQVVAVYGRDETGFRDRWSEEVWISASSWTWTPDDNTFYLLTEVNKAHVCLQAELPGSEDVSGMAITLITGTEPDPEKTEPTALLVAEQGQATFEFDLQPGVYTIALQSDGTLSSVVFDSITFTECGGE